MTSITKLPFKFDENKIIDSLPQDVWQSTDFGKHLQLAVQHSEDSDSWFDGIGMTYDRKTGQVTKSTKDYTILNAFFHGTYMEEVVNTVKEQAKLDGVNIGRIRILGIRPKTCYSLHKDVDEFRYHIPLITNFKSFFVVGNAVERMPLRGQLYKLRTLDFHTAVNAHFSEFRYHLVFDTYQ